jgi:DHA1 family multidrug resistance protein-like MFS transporter
VLALASAVAFIEAVLFTSMAPLLPYYEKSLGLSESSAGVFVASYAVGAFAAAFPSMALARRAGVKTTVTTGFIVLASSTLALGFADSLPAVIGSRFGQGAGSAIALTGAIAWLTGVTDASQRAGAIGIAFSAAFIGALLGPVIGATAASVGIAPVFTAVAFGTAVLAVATLALEAPSGSRLGKTPPLLQLFRDHAARIGIWLILVAGVYLGVIGVLVPLQLDRLGLSATEIGAAFATAAVIQAIASPLIGRLADTRGRAFPIRIALSTATVTLLLLTFDDRAWLYAGLAVVGIVSLGMIWAPSTALLADAAERRGFDQSTAAGMMNVAWAPGFAVGGIAAGVLAETLGDAVPYVLMSMICIGSLVLLGRQQSE